MASTDTLILLSKAFDSFFKKARNRARILANNRRMARRNEKIMRSATREMLNYITEEVQKGLPKLKSGKASAIKRMVDWKHIEEQAALIIKPAMLAVLVEGGKSIVERHIMKQERFDPIGVAAVDWSSNHSANLVTEITKKQRTAIRGFTVNGLNAGKSIPAIMRELRPTVGILEKYTKTIATARAKMIAEGVPAATIATRTDRMARHYHHLRINTIARTETSAAQNEGILQGYGQMGIKRVEGISDPDACDDCKDEISGKIYTLAEASGKLPLHPDCLPGDSLVSTCDFISGATKRWYEGKVIVIKTASGKNLTATPNHPILSERGWIPINLLDFEDNVISLDIRHNGLSGIEKNIKYVPTPIEQIVETFFLSDFTLSVKTPITLKDFHGDVVSNGQVAIVGTNRLLGNTLNPSFFKKSNDSEFRRPNRTLSDFSSYSSFQSFFNGNYSSMPTSGNGCLLGQINEPLSRLETQSLRATSVYPSSFDNFINPRGTNSVLAGNLIGRHSRFIKLDNIIDIHTEYYIGYIYNLQTKNHYYIANGIIVHNCECTWVAAAGERPKPYEFVASGRNEAKIASLDNTLKGLPRRHVSGVEKYHIDTTAKIEKNVPAFKGRDIAGYWDNVDKSVHYNALHMDKRVIFHEVGHSVYETSVPYNQKSLWTAWHKKASTTMEMQYPSAYSLTNVDEFFAECYAHYHMKKYNQIDKVVKKWFDKSLKGGG